ncbi:MAG: hypothetical protein AAF465_13545 [Pseudomonadota bacterium]
MLATAEVKSYFDIARPVVLAALPPMTLFVLASFLPTVWGIHTGVPVAVLACAATFFFLNRVQQNIEEMPYGPAQVCVSFPFTALTLTWLIALVTFDDLTSIGKILPGYLLAMLTGLWPIFRKSRENEIIKRRMEYVTSAVIATGVYLTLIIAGVLS